MFREYILVKWLSICEDQRILGRRDNAFDADVNFEVGATERKN